MFKAFSSLFRLSFCTLGYLCATTTATSAQVTSDGTVNTQVTPDGNVAEITGGETRGGNLFHSFQDFSIQTGNEAFFNNAESISNIFSRVTGGNISNIDGAIRANGDASLFLINPAGIIFGENASLNLGGSFYGSTADSILFEDGQFSATNLDNSLLTINAPVGLNLRDNPGEIVNRSTADGVGLQVDSGEAISLIGGDINFEGGLITAPGGTIQLGGLSQTGTVSIADDSSLNFPSDVIKANVFLSDNAAASITANGGGSISVNANNLELTGDSLIEASIGEGLGSENAVAGTIEIATDTLQIDNNSAIVASTFGQGDAGTINITARNIAIEQEFSGIYSNVGLNYIATEDAVADAVGNGGEININTDTLSLTDGARITSNSVATGDAGDIKIDATGEVLYSGVGTTPVVAFDGGTVISGSFSQVQQNGVGSSGQVNIKAGSLTLTDTGAVLVDNSGQQGNAGDITLDIENEIFLDGALIISQLQKGAIGNGGDINITANSLVARNSSLILADTKGQGNAGNITINADEAISLEDEGTIINSFVEEGAIGNGGNISLDVGELNLTNKAEINADTAGKGNAGNIAIEVAGDIKLDDGGKIQSQTRGNAIGDAGNITINGGGSFSFTNGSLILADSQAQGDSGDITIIAREQILLEDGTRINNLVEEGAIGNGGDISLVAGELNLINKAEINADTAGKGNAGNVSVEVAGDIRFDNGSKIQSQTRQSATGNAGNIAINSGGSLTFANGSFIFADSQAQGDGGKIAIVVKEQILLEGFSLVNNDPNPDTPSQIVAGLSRENAVGRGGDIEITADSLVLNEAASISSNTILGSKGTAGDITVNVDSLQIKENSLINVFTGNEDPGGAVTVNARTLDLTNGGKILAATTGEGNAGNIDLNVSEQIDIDGVESSTTYISNQPRLQFLDDLQDEPSGIYANTIEGATGDGGNISLKSQSLKLDNGANITASTRSGTGGTIELVIDADLILDRNSSISARAFGQANGGNLNIDARYIFAFPSNGIGNDLVATAEKGTGGDININAEQIFGLEVGNAIDAQNNFIPNNNNDIDVSGNFDGNITINTTRVNNIQEPTELPQNTVDLEETIAQACQRDPVAAAKNSFSIEGQGGIIPEPGSPLNSSNIYVNGNDATSAIPKPIETAQGKIQPARGIKVTESGEIVLTAYRTNNAGERLLESDRNCGV